MTWILVDRPPRERPNACLAAEAGGVNLSPSYFFRLTVFVLKHCTTIAARCTAASAYRFQIKSNMSATISTCGRGPTLEVDCHFLGFPRGH